MHFYRNITRPVVVRNSSVTLKILLVAWLELHNLVCRNSSSHVKGTVNFLILSFFLLSRWDDGLRAGRPLDRVPAGAHLLPCPSAFFPTQPLMECILGVKRPEREAGHSLLYLMPKFWECGVLPTRLHALMLNTDITLHSAPVVTTALHFHCCVLAAFR